MSALVPKVTRELTLMRRTLRKTFGLDRLRPGQAEVMRSVLEGNNTLAIMPINNQSGGTHWRRNSTEGKLACAS
jgi:hypothetical protein